VKSFAVQEDKAEPIEQISQQPIREFSPESPAKKPPQSLSEQNYTLFTELLPEFEDRAVTQKTLRALSDLPGFHGILLCQPVRIESHEIDLQLWHFVGYRDTYVPESMFSMRVNLAAQTIEPLVYAYKGAHQRVYHRSREHGIELVDRKAEAEQVQLINAWLKNLLHFKHVFSWNESEAVKKLFCTLTMCQFNSPESIEERKNEDYEEKIETLKKRVKKHKRTIKTLEGNGVNTDFRLFNLRREIDQQRSDFEQEKKNNPVRIAQEQQRQADEFRDRINEFIPDFEPGKVLLTKAHMKIGITQEDIDYVNTHRQGLITTPNPNFPSSDPYRQKGFRIDKWGKVYFKGRSNR
jgi:hypothetical protein